MISIKDLRKQPELYKEMLALKNDHADVDQLLLLDKTFRRLQTEVNHLRAERNSASEAIGLAKKAGQDASGAIKQTRELGDRLKEIENRLHQTDEELNKILYQIPNLPHETVPKGSNEINNVEIKSWGKKPDFMFTPKSHLQLGESLTLFDFERGAKLSGSGFPLYVGKGAQLERALINAMVDHHEREYGFTELFPPVLMRKESMVTTGQLPKFEEDMYHTEVDNLYLAPTAEVPVTNVHRDEILDESELPIYYVA
ncbi:MAG: serine--tRNA ligase, partial [Candidatus Marinimicrobia bacterium]|nr:serine--tRNA ligase [Candidatus Neomarinimicrobiota bacterium]